jgi:hypothetical protein
VLASLPFGGERPRVWRRLPALAEGNRGARLGVSILGGNREGVSSVDLALRADLFGFAIGQFDFARSLQRVDKGWLFQFNLSPGF